MRSSELAPERQSGAEARSEAAALHDLVVCSLEAWDEVWRRNQFFVAALLRRQPRLRVLFVEPAADPLHDACSRRPPSLPRLRRPLAEARLRTLRPLKPLPRRFGPVADLLLHEQVLIASRLLGLRQPVLWINDASYAPLITRTGWPSLYDITDDWLLAPFSPRELARLRRLDELALAHADEVVVCSPALAASRGAVRTVSLVPNGVDVAHLRAPQPRPAEFPQSPVAVYVGSLHEARIDVDLVCALAGSLPEVSFVFVGPDALARTSRRRLRRSPNVRLLGPRPYARVPAYLQHADAVIVPHRVSPFTDSLDPIKAYECLAIDTPTVATPIAGFREQAGALEVVEPSAFAARLADILAGRVAPRERGVPIGWQERALTFEAALLRAASRSPR